MAYTITAIISICLVALCPNVEAAPRVDPLVETELGLIRGLVSDDGSYSLFMGIPYAYVNESNPFGPAIPNEGFETSFEAYDDSALCPQYDVFNREIRGSLDCLHLHVYVPQTASSSNRLPVLVWIHGGSFRNGFAGRFYFGPTYIMRQDIIFVSINYRLGPYGFMCLNTPEVPGNQGFKDQALALKWIKDNIAAFGGDADKITISGESAGAMAVDIHLLYSPKELFHKAILQSGTALTALVVQDPDIEAPLKLADQLGFETNDISKALTYLSSVDPLLLIAAGSQLGLVFSGCVEEDFNNGQRLITDDPMSVSPNLNNIPILIGLTSREYRLAYPYFVSMLGNQNILNALNRDPNLLERFYNDEEIEEMERLIRHFYMGDEDYNEDTIWSVIDLTSDSTFNFPTMRSIQRYFDLGVTNIYQYIFSYVGERYYNYAYDETNLTIPDGSGAGHFSEIGYQFDTAYMNEPNADDQIIIDRMNTMWANFAKYSNPTPETTDLLPVTWPRATKERLAYLDIDANFTIGSRPFHDRMAFWDLFYSHYNISISYHP